MDPLTASTASLGYEAVRSLRQLQDETLRAAALCENNLAVIKCLAESRGDEALCGAFESMTEKLRGYILGFETLQKRMNNAIELVSHPPHHH